MSKKICIKNSPLTVIDNRFDFVLLSNGDGETATTSSVNVNVANDKLRMSTWKFDSTLRVGGEMTVTSELLDVVNNSDVKVILHGVVLDVIGKETELRGTVVDVMKKHNKMNLVIGSSEPRTWISNVSNLGVVTARLSLTIEYLDLTIPCLEGAMKRFLDISLQDFLQTMKVLLASPSFTNAKIVCGAGVEIGVNKEILPSRSPVFEAMFRTDMMESATGVVQVTDICEKTMRVFVEYLNTGNLDESWNAPDIVTDLARAADKYGIESLQSFLDDGLGDESLIRSNFELLNVAADYGYTNAELKIAVTLGRRAKSLKTRDELFYEVGMNTGTMDKRRKNLMKTRLLSWINSDLSHCRYKSSLELVNLAVELNLHEIEKRLMEDLGKRLESAQSRDEVLEVLEIPQCLVKFTRYDFCM